MDAFLGGFLPVEVKIGRAVDEALVDGIDVDVLRRNVAKIDGIDQGGDALVFRHARDGHDVFHLRAVRRFILPDGPLCLEEARPGRHADGF